MKNRLNILQSMMKGPSLQRGVSDFLTRPFFENDVIHPIDLVRKKRDLERQRQGLMMELELRVKEKTDELIQKNRSGAMHKTDA